MSHDQSPPHAHWVFMQWNGTRRHFRTIYSERLEGFFYGTVMEFRHGREFFLADAYWLPPASDPIGPMALEVTCRVEGAGTRLQVRQRGADESARWKRYNKLIEAGWKDSLVALLSLIHI